MSSEEEATIYKCVGFVKVLNSYLEMMREKLGAIDFEEYGMLNPFGDVVFLMSSELDRVFSPFVNPNNPRFDGIYFAVALLHGHFASRFNRRGKENW